MSPDLLIPAIIAFTLILIGLALTIYEFYTEKNIGDSPVNHGLKITKPSPDQVVSSGERIIR